MEPTDERPSKRAKLSLASFQNPLQLVVGVNKVEVTAPRGMICGESQFFEVACKPQWMAEGTNTVLLPDEDPIIFSLFLNWMHTGDISSSGDFISVTDQIEEAAKAKRQEQWMQLLKCYILGDMLIARNFQNAVVDSLLILCRTMWSLHKIVAGIEVESIALVYSNTLSAESPLRRLIVENCLKFATCGNSTLLKSAYPSETSEDSHYSGFLTEVALSALSMNRQFENKFLCIPAVWENHTCTYHQHDDGEKCIQSEPVKQDGYRSPYGPAPAVSDAFQYGIPYGRSTSWPVGGYSDPPMRPAPPSRLAIAYPGSVPNPSHRRTARFARFPHLSRAAQSLTSQLIGSLPPSLQQPPPPVPTIGSFAVSLSTATATASPPASVPAKRSRVAQPSPLGQPPSKPGDGPHRQPSDDSD